MDVDAGHMPGNLRQLKQFVYCTDSDLSCILLIHLLAEPTTDLARWMLAYHRTLSGGACLVCVESTERGTIALLFQDERQRLTLLPMAESRTRDERDIADPLLVGKWSATPYKDSR